MYITGKEERAKTNCYNTKGDGYKQQNLGGLSK